MTDRIAVVVDHANNREMIWKNLSSKYELLVEQNLPLDSNPDLYFLDWSGFKRCEQEIRGLKNEVKQGDGTVALPVVLLTRESELSRARKQLQGPVDDLLVTPIPSDLLKTRLDNHLTQRELSVELKRFNDTLQQRVEQKTQTIRAREEEIVFRLVAASLHRDEETGGHIQRIGQSSQVMAKNLGWREERVRNVRLAAMMHDIGKIGIPDGILQKPGDLTDDEYETMQSHTTLGAQIIGETDVELLGLARTIALTHHEKWDGSGYPEGLAGDDIPEVGRLVGIVDVYDALTHDRVYRDAMPEDKALGIIEDDVGTHFDPEMYDCFMEGLPSLRSIGEQEPDESKI